MSLEQINDKVCFDLLSKRQPSAIAAIRQALALGATAKMIEKRAIAQCGPPSLTAAVFAGAAHYIEKQMKKEQSS